VWQTFRKSDANVITSFEQMTAMLDTTAQLQIRLAENLQQMLGRQLVGAVAQPLVAELVKAEQSLAFHLAIILQLDGVSFNVQIRRYPKQATDAVHIDYPDQVAQELVLKVLIAAGNEFPTYARAESIDRLLGDDLAEFYRAREAGLLRLETLNQKLIEDTDAYRQRLDERFDAKAAALDEQTATQRAELESAAVAERERLAAERSELEAREKSLAS
jgi:hypothetical protein